MRHATATLVVALALASCGHDSTADLASPLSAGAPATSAPNGPRHGAPVRELPLPGLTASMDASEHAAWVTRANAARLDGGARYLTLGGTFDAAGRGRLLGPPFRIPGQCTRPRAPGDIVATLLDASSAVLARAQLDMPTLSEQPLMVSFAGCLQDAPSATRLILERDGLSFFEASASTHAPEVRILTSDHAVVDRSRGDVLRWVIHDDDDDALWVRVATSTDGLVWYDQRTSSVPGEPLTLDSSRLSLDYADLHRFWLEVEVSDGFSSGFDRIGPLDVIDCPVVPGSERWRDSCLAARHAESER